MPRRILAPPSVAHFTGDKKVALGVASLKSPANSELHSLLWRATQPTQHLVACFLQQWPYRFVSCLCITLLICQRKLTTCFTDCAIPVKMPPARRFLQRSSFLRLSSNSSVTCLPIANGPKLDETTGPKMLSDRPRNGPKRGARPQWLRTLRCRPCRN